MTKQDSDALLEAIFKTVQKHLPDEPLAVKSDLATDLFDTVYRWGNPEVDPDQGDIYL